jgi:CDP-6-deoxy-D-xylo-4-hexulose-3-dehydrase
MSLDKLKKDIKKVFNDQNHFNFKKISVAFPYYDEKEIITALDSLLKLEISQGKKTKKFEFEYAKYHKMKYGIAVNSGSSANLVALTSLMETGYLKKNDEIIVPATTFATVVSPIYQLGLKPVYIDIEDKTWNINSELISSAITKKTKLIMIVHQLGFPANMKKINKIAKNNNLLVLEDCCEAHGALFGKKIIGSMSDISTFSFFVAHNITTGEGGMILTNNKKLNDSMRSVREFGRLINFKKRFSTYGKMKNYDSRYMFVKLGYNLRMTDIAAGIGLEQLKKLKSINKIRRKNAKYLTSKLSLLKSLYIPSSFEKDLCAYYGYPIMLINKKFSRNKLCSYLEKNNIETRAIMGGCLPDQLAFKDLRHKIIGNLNVSREVKNNAFFIGIHSALSKKNLDYIADTIKSFFDL